MTSRRRVLSAVLATLCLVALVGVVAGASGVAVLTDDSASQAPQPAANGSASLQEKSISYLSPPPSAVDREAHYSTGLDVATAVTADVQRLRGNYTKLAFDQRRTSLDSPERQREYFNQTINRTVDRIVALDGDHAAAIEAYNEGDLSTGSFLREFLRIEIAADQQREFAEYVDLFQLEGTVPPAVDTEIVMLPDPVAADIETASRQGTGEAAVYLQTSDDAVVLASAGQEYLRQATLREERDPSLPDQFAGDDLITNVTDRMKELYPWARVVGFQSRSGGLYRVELDHESTEVEVLLDGGTTNVFHEIQRVDTPSLPVSETITNTSAGHTVSVETTQPTGPMRVSVVDETSGQPQSATVYVDGNRVGPTGVDGRRFVVQPVGSFELSVETSSGETVTVSGP